MHLPRVAAVASLAAALAACAGAARTPTPARASHETTPVARPAAVVVPLHLVLLHDSAWGSAGTSPAFDARVAQVIEDVNAIFAATGVQFSLADVTATAPETASPKATSAGVIEALPPVDRPRAGLRIYLAGRLDVNGIGVGTRAALVQEHAALRPVLGGTEDAVARVMSHMLGALLGLEPVGAERNVMALGTSGCEIDAGQSAVLRGTALRLLSEAPHQTATDSGSAMGDVP